VPADMDIRSCASTRFPRPFVITGSPVLAPDFGESLPSKCALIATVTRRPSAVDIGVDGMLLHKMLQRFRQLRNAIGVATLRCHTDIFYNHLTDALGPIDLMQQMIGKCRCKNARYAFMFGYRLDLLGVETAHCNAILQ